ncbi:MAG TPA: hypothetical protein VFE62_22965 [Gemmataceae bacterium]|nr:hypothetical protein [Gemmataceae bacterium]
MLTWRLFVLPATAFFVATGAAAHALDVKCLPDNTELVVGVNLKQIRTSKRVSREKDALDQPRAMLKRAARELPVLACVQDAGLDLVNDLNAITFAGPQAKTPQVTFLALEGDFVPLKLADRLAELAKKRPEQVKLTMTGSATFYQMTGAGKTVHHAALVNGSTLIAATTREALTEAMERCNGSRKSNLAKGITLESGDDHSIRLVATGPALARLLENASIPNADTAVAALDTCQSVSASLRLSQELEFHLGIQVRDAEMASKIAAAGINGLRSLRVLAHQQAREKKKLQPIAEIVDGLRVTSQGPNVVIRGEATLNAIEIFLRDFPVSPAERPR